MLTNQENAEDNQSPLSAIRPKNATAIPSATKLQKLLSIAHQKYNTGKYKEAQSTCESIYHLDACMKENLLLLGAIHFQLRNFSECIFYNQQAIRIEPTFAEAFGNLGNALKELGDIHAAVQSYLKAIKYKPRFSDAYNNLASAYAQLGDTKQAIDTYEMALLLNPGLADARSNLGNLYKAQGNLEAAKRHYQEAIRINPKFTIAWSNLAGIFREQGDTATAISYYEEAVRLTPDFADGHSNLGNALRDANRLEEAIESYKLAIKIRPDFAIAHGNLANALFVSGDVQGAIRKYKNAIQLEPNFPDAHCNLANALLSLGRMDEAISRYHIALRLKPDHPHAYNNLGTALKDKGLVKEAIHCYMTACRLMPHFAEAHCNLGSLLKEQGKLEQAIAHYSEAIAINPAFADAHSNMGNAYKEQGNYTEAIRCYRKAIKITPKFPEAYNNLASAFKDAGRLDDAIMCYKKALDLKADFSLAFANMFNCMSSICDWRSREDNLKIMKDIIMNDISKENTNPSLQPFHSLGYPLSGEVLKQIAIKFSKRTRANVALLSLPGFKFKIKMPQTRLKIGYASCNFGNYSTTHSILNLFSFHNRDEFEVYCYSLRGDDESSQRRHIQETVENFKDLSNVTNSDAAHIIHADGIHVLVNLDGYTKNCRNEIFALQPAPIQVAFQGYPGTSGADYIHYLICDKVVAPLEHADQFTEKLVHLPNTCIFTDHKQSSMEVTRVENCSSREDFGIPEDKFVFCCFNQLFKIDPKIFDVWCKILSRVPNSLLWLVRFPQLGEANLKAEAKARGIDEKRIFFTNTIPRYQHLKRTYLADLCLDSQIFNGQSTTCDVLWGGTPVVTLEGQTMASRLGSSILRAAGFPELIATSLTEYENKAVELATNIDRVWEMRKKIEASRETSVLFDTKQAVKDLEKGYHAIFKRHEMGLERDHISIE